MQTFSFSPPINLFEERRWFLAVTSFEATNSVFNTTSENNSFSISIPGHWNSKDNGELNIKLNKLLELRSENDIELHVKDHFPSEILSELKRVRYRDLEDLVTIFLK